MTLELLRAVGPVAALLLFVGLVLLYRRIYRFTRRPPGQVIAYLRAVAPADVGGLLDPVAEQYVRLNLTKAQFRKEQRNRMWLALEYIGRLSHNALIMAEWGYYELKRTRRTRSPLDHETATELLSASVQVRMCGFVLRATMHVWLLRMAVLPFLRPPSFEKLIDAGSTDLLEFYRTMTDAAMRLSQAYGDLHYEKMAQALQPS